MTEPFTSEPYGRKLGLASGAAVQLQRVTARQYIFGVQTGYEVLRHRTPIQLVFDQHDFGLAAKGHATLANQFINLHPFFGHRFTRRKLDFDLTAGPEIGFLRRSHETAQAKSEAGTDYTTDLDRSHPSVDVRARLDLTAYHNRVGVSLGYSAGLTNYSKTYIGGVNDLHSQAFRLGLAYRIYSI